VLENSIRIAEKVLLWVTCLAVLVAAIVFIVLALSRSSDAADLVFGPQPEPHMGTAVVAVSAPKPKPSVRVLSRIVAAPVVRRNPVAPKPPAPPQGSIQARLVAAWPGDDGWALRVVACESGFDNASRHPSSGADGYWQFLPSTWHSMLGQSGWPSDHSLEYQTAQAWRLYQMAGPSQWVCSG
jgi:hypothetical protein